MKKNLLLVILFACTIGLRPQAQTVTDVEGTVYNTVTLGNQVWMKENLRTGKYRDGTALGTDWTQIPYVGTCGDYAHVGSYDTVYGKLYNFYAVENARNLCPAGYHIPTDRDWLTLRAYLGGASVAGGKMKETGTLYWTSPNTGADNSSGFSARPAGSESNASFYGLGTGAGWWANKVDSITGYAVGYGVSNSSAALTSGETIKSYGSSVRCVADAAVSGFNDIEPVKFTVYPNPAANEINIKTDAQIDRVEVYNAAGALQVSSGKYSINTTQLAAGTYFIKVFSAGKVSVQQFVK